MSANWHKRQIGYPTIAEATHKGRDIRLVTGYNIATDGYLVHAYVDGRKVDVAPRTFASEDEALDAGFAMATRAIG